MSDTETNPLLKEGGLPAFSAITPEHIVPAVERLFAQGRETIAKALARDSGFTWDNLVRPIEDADDRLSKAWSPVRHLHAVADKPALRDAYNACLPKLSEYATEIGQNERLFKAYAAIGESGAYQQLTQPQRKVIDNALRDFRLSGVDLADEKKARFKEISSRLSELSSKFGENVLDATQAWKKHVTSEHELAGMPETAVALVRDLARREDLEGWLLNLEFPCYLPVMSYADDRSLRREMYEAYTTRASDQGPHAGQWDNSALMDEIVALRHEKAQLVGFANYAEYSLPSKMAKSPDQVMEFLTDLAQRSKPVAEQELDELRAFARQHHGHDELEAWDITYYAEKLRRHKYALSQEDLRPYFAAPRVINGLFEVVKRLYGLDIRETEGVDTWHPDVRFYEIRDTQGTLRGRFYIDLYARAHKRGGAWMDECVVRRRHNETLQNPVAYLTCNFTPPVGDRPALLTHDEVTTLFHEFGHGLHHMLTRIDYAGVSGINGVAWDAVELPSQFMENWCWEREALDLFAAHFETGERLPEDLYRKMRAAKSFQTGMHMARQLELALFDFRLHLEYSPERGARIQPLLDEVRDAVAVVKPPAFNRFTHGFSHIFAGGYAAGYYSYKWAEVLSSDAFSKFEENGIFDPTTGAQFLHAILEQGGSKDAMDLFVEFRGREPTIDALLRHSGISTGNASIQD